ASDIDGEQVAVMLAPRLARLPAWVDKGTPPRIGQRRHKPYRGDKGRLQALAAPCKPSGVRGAEGTAVRYLLHIPMVQELRLPEEGVLQLRRVGGPPAPFGGILAELRGEPGAAAVERVAHPRVAVR